MHKCDVAITLYADRRLQLGDNYIYNDLAIEFMQGAWLIARSNCCYFVSSSNSMLISKSCPSNGEHYSKNCRGLKVYWGTTCGKGGPSVAAIIGPGGPSTATKIAMDGPGGPLAAGDQLRRDIFFCR